MTKKAITPILFGLLLVACAYAFLQRQSAKGSERILESIRSIRQGASEKDVRNILGRDPVIIEASGLPDWLKEVVSEKEKGEYWYYFMGYPARNLIIYFGEDRTVGYVTWTHT